MQPVQTRRLQARIAVGGKIAIALIVAENNDHVRMRRAGSCAINGADPAENRKWRRYIDDNFTTETGVVRRLLRISNDAISAVPLGVVWTLVFVHRDFSFSCAWRLTLLSCPDGLP